MAQYVDGFVIPMKKTAKNIKSYKKMATMGRNLWMKHGALSYYECLADEFLPYGIGFKKMCKLKPSETVVFAYIVFKSKAHRNKVNKAVHKAMDSFEMTDMPFDMKRFSVAGFKTLVRSKK